jgi:regulatory factor X
MQQQFFSLSPMAGQESFGPVGHVLAHTPTTSSMLAALQQDSFHTGLDHNSSQFGGDAYGGMGGFIDNMDTAGSANVVVDDGGASGLFGDYSGSGFDAFAAGELSTITAATPDVVAEESGVKVEPAP